MSKLYIALDYCNFDWDPKEVKRVEEMWRSGDSILTISRSVKRPIKEVFLLIFDRLDQGYLKPRKGSIFGEK